MGFHRYAQGCAAAFVLGATVALGGQPAVVVTMSGVPPTLHPGAVSIHAGDTIEWRNTSAMPHSISFDPSQAATPERVVLPAGVKPFSSGDLRPEQRWRHTFDAPGEYRYFCRYHDWADMTGTVEVLP